MPRCYICGEQTTNDTGMLVQPHEGVRHPLCDPSPSPASTPATLAGLEGLPERELVRHARLTRQLRDAGGAE